MDNRYDNDFGETINSGNATTATLVVSGTEGKILHISDIIISVDTEMNVQLQDQDEKVLVEKLYLPANSVFSKSLRSPIHVTSGKGVYVKGSAVGNITVFLGGESK